MSSETLTINNYDKERNHQVYRANDCKYRYGDSNGAGCYQLHGILTSVSMVETDTMGGPTFKPLDAGSSLYICPADGAIHLKKMQIEEVSFKKCKLILFILYRDILLQTETTCAEHTGLKINNEKIKL
jgi:hypothetical protein